MRWEMKCTTKTARLRKRTGPSTSYRIVSWIYPGQTGIVVDSKKVGGATWYKWENSNLWSCGRTAKGVDYLTKIKDLDPPKPVTPPNPKPEPKPTVDITEKPYTPPTYNTSSINNNLGYTPGEDSWYAKSEFNYGTYDKVSDNTIMKEIARIKYNMDISYSDRNDIYDNKSNGYFSDLQAKLHHSFNRNKTAFPDRELTKTFAYVFFTRPDLNIINMKADTKTFSLNPKIADPKYAYLFKNNPNCLRSLVTAGNPHHKFLVLLSNEAKSFEVSDLALKTTEHGETYTGNKVIYGRTDHESNAAGEISVRYVDTVNLDIFKMHTIWVDYINKVSRGIFEPREKYIKDRILDYASSCYYFLCGPDGSTILYWQKLTGVFPINTGENVFSWDSGTLLAKPEINIKYVYAFKTPMDIAHLYEFNSLTKNTNGNKFKSVYSASNVQSGSTLTHSPYIWKTTMAGKEVYRLMWFDNK